MICYKMENPAIINLMRSMSVEGGIVLEDMHRMYPSNTKLYSGRPEMLVMRMMNGRNMQMFRRGKVQILGRITDGEAENMRLELITKLRTLNVTRPVTAMTISNLVVSATLKKKLCPKKTAWTDYNVFHEMELFPAVLIRKWHPVHIALFLQTGEVILTALKSTNDFYVIMNELCSFLEDSHYFIQNEK